jgi:hypothetical protein
MAYSFLGDPAHYMKAPSLKEKASLFAQFSDPPKFPKASAYCEDSPSVIHNPDTPPPESSQNKVPVKFKAKKIKSLNDGELKHPHTEEECNAFLVESIESAGNGDFSTTFEETIGNLANGSSGFVKSNWPKNAEYEAIDGRTKCKVLSEKEIEEAKETARREAMSEAERDADERFGGLS